LLALFCLDTPAAHSTTVIAIATPDGIVVGTDAPVTTGSYGDVNHKTYGLDTLRGMVEDFRVLRELKLNQPAYGDEMRKPSRPWLKYP
jgi:20S proteasome alpha/beta subunit